MPKIEYSSKKLSPAYLAVVEQANEILAEYDEAGYDLTLRQLYYQFVSRSLIPNNQKEYKRLGDIISAGRRAGLIDWSSIVDRTRHVRHPKAWDSVEEIVRAVAEQYDVDWWLRQDFRPEVWIEKDALVGVLEVACEPWHVPYFSCRGFVSDSEIWASAQRFRKAVKAHQTPIVLHLGDHDPSGIDMTRDVSDRLTLFAGFPIPVRRLALTMEQVEEYEPPPNPAKTTDSRFAGYQELYGDESWELDALDPDTIARVIADEIKPLINEQAWASAEHDRDMGRAGLMKASENWPSVVKYLNRKKEN